MANCHRSSLAFDEDFEEEDAGDGEAFGRGYVPVVRGEALFIFYVEYRVNTSIFLSEAGWEVLTKDVFERSPLCLLVYYH